MQSKSGEQLFNANFKAIVFLFIAVIIATLVLFVNPSFQSIYLLKSFGELSVEPETAFKNNKPTFLEFYAEWCEVCKEMAPKVSALKDEYEEDINFVFLNVDNQKWDNYIREFEVNGIPQVNLFDREGNLISTFIGKQEEIIIKDYLNKLKGGIKSGEDVINAQFSVIKENKNNAVSPRNHG